MTQETMTDLQFNTLIGMVEERGSAWHRRDDLRRNADGSLAEDNHYPRFIPVEDVRRRLFHWMPRTVPVAYLVPCDVAEADVIRKDGTPCKVIETQAGRVGVLRDDNDYDMGVFKEGVQHPPYNVTLIREAERLTGTTLGISSAGLLAKGGRAWVEFSLPETLHDAKTGFSYRPNLLKADSMDGSISMTTARTINATVCDNTLTWNLLEAKTAGLLFKRKHTSGFGDLQDERDALGILEQTDSEFLSELHALIEREVNEKQVISILDIIMPIPEDDGRGKTLVLNKRDQWMNLYTSDPMAAPWTGTAFGVVQTHNTYDHWFSPVRGTGRSERNTWRAINGKRSEADREIVQALERVLV